MIKRLLSLCLIFIFLTSCQQEEDVNPFQKTASSLKGKWKLVSFESRHYDFKDSLELEFSGVATDSTATSLEFTDREMIWNHPDNVVFNWPYSITSDTTLTFIVAHDGYRYVTIEELTANKLVYTTRYQPPSGFGRMVVKNIYTR